MTINLGQLSAFSGSEEVTLESLKAKNILNVSGKQAKLPLKVSSTLIAMSPKAMMQQGNWHSQVKLLEAEQLRIESSSIAEEWRGQDTW